MVRVKWAWKLESLELESFPCWPSRGSDGKSPQAQPENKISCHVFFHLHLPVLQLAGSALALRWWGRGRGEKVVFLSFSLCKWTSRANKIIGSGKRKSWKASLGRWRCHLSHHSFGYLLPKHPPLEGNVLPECPAAGLQGYYLEDGGTFWAQTLRLHLSGLNMLQHRAGILRSRTKVQLCFKKADEGFQEASVRRGDAQGAHLWKFKASTEIFEWNLACTICARSTPLITRRKWAD